MHTPVVLLNILRQKLDINVTHLIIVVPIGTMIYIPFKRHLEAFNSTIELQAKFHYTV